MNVKFIYLSIYVMISEGNTILRKWKRVSFTERMRGIILVLDDVWMTDDIFKTLELSIYLYKTEK